MPCGPGKLGDKLVPDSPLGLELSKCCVAHDMAYKDPGPRARFDCDLEFLYCMLGQARKHAGLKEAVFVRIAIRYYGAVRMLGWIAWWRCRRREMQKRTNAQTQKR